MQFATPPKPIENQTRPVLIWEEAACPLCASRHGTTLIEGQDQNSGEEGLWFAVVQCDSCGACFTNPRPDPASIAQFYLRDYAPHQKHHQPKPSKRFNPFRVLKQPRVEKRPIPWHGQGRLLDFGCGTGAYLLQMHQRNWRVAGLDISGRVTQRIRDELGIPAFTGTLPHPDIEPESFDVITMWHSLEHCHDPMIVLREARNLLAPGGKIVISVPNIDSLAFRWFGRHWFGLDVPRHLMHFTPASLLEMMQRCGFATEPIRHIHHADWLRFTAKRACKAQAKPALWQRLLRYRIPSNIVSWHSCTTQQSDVIFAVGHR